MSADSTSTDPADREETAKRNPTGADAPPLSRRREVWRGVQECIKERLGRERFGLWFKQTELMELGQSRLVVGVPNVIIKQYLEREYQETVRSAAAHLLGRPVEVRFDIAPQLLRSSREGSLGRQEDARQGTPDTEPQQGEAAAPGRPAGHTFESLVITEANRLPALAVQQIATRDEVQFDFLLLLGDYGTGKSALMEAAYRAGCNSPHGSPAIYAGAEGWSNDYYHAVRSKRTRTFRRRHRGCRLLLLDGIQFLQGKPAAQDELLYTVKTLKQGGGRVVLSSAVHPHELDDVRPAFGNLLGGAIWVELSNPPLEERVLLARRLARRQGLQAEKKVFEVLAEGHGSTVQQLCGAVRSVAAYASLQGIEKVDVAVAREALVATRRLGRRVPNLGNIARTVQEVFEVGEEELKGKSRCRSTCRARQVAMYLARRLTGHSLSEIGRHFGGRSHSTVKHSVERAQDHIDSDPRVARRVKACRRRLGAC